MEALVLGELTLLVLKLVEVEQNLDHDLVPTQGRLVVEVDVLEAIHKLLLATVLHVPKLLFPVSKKVSNTFH